MSQPIDGTESVTKQEAIEFIRELREMRRRKSDAFDGYTGDYSEYDDLDACGFEYAGVRWESWHEASDPRGAEKALKILFDIEESEISDTEGTDTES